MTAFPGPDNEKEHIERLRQAMYSRDLSEKLKARERRGLADTHTNVGEDWKRPEPEMQPMLVAPRRIGWGRQAFFWIFGVALVFFMGAGGFFLYYFFFGGGAVPASPENISIAMSGPAQLAGGEPTELQIAVTNSNKVPLESAELVLHYPPGTRPPGVPAKSSQLEPCSGTNVSDTALNLSEQRICLGTIEPGGVRQGTVSAIFVGTEGARENVKAELEYHVQGSNSIFVASSAYTLNFTSAPLAVSVDGNTQSISGQAALFKVTVSSNSAAPIKDVLLSMESPFGFKQTSATPATFAAGLWALGDFGPGEKKTVTIGGVLTGEAGDERVFHFVSGTRKDIKNKSVDTPLSSVTFHSSISQPFLQLALAVNDVGGNTVTVSPGEKVSVSIAYQNNLPTAIQNVVIVAKVNGLEIDGSTVKSVDGFFRSSDGAMFWDKTTTNGVLAALSPGQKGVVTFSFQMPTSDMLAHVTNPRIDLSVNAAGNRVSETGVPQVLQSTARGVISLASDLALVAQGLYYSNPFGSTGPMPPKAGTETTYAMVFTVTNTTNKISEATLTAELPPYVRWVGIYSPASEKITFNQLNGTITWHLGDVAPGVGVGASQPRQAAIAVGFTPSSSQIGQQPTLLHNINLNGVDASSTDPISRHVDDLTTNLTKVSQSSPSVSTVGDAGFNINGATVVK